MFPKAMAEQYYRAQQLFDAGKPEQALPLLEEIHEVAPNHPMIMQGRAMCLHALGRDDEAFVLCNKMYTMHNDRRGLEMRMRWEAEKRGGSPDAAFDDVMEPLAVETPAFQWRNLGVIVSLGIIGLVVVLIFARQLNAPPAETVYVPHPHNAAPARLGGGAETAFPAAARAAPAGGGHEGIVLRGNQCVGARFIGHGR